MGLSQENLMANEPTKPFREPAKPLRQQPPPNIEDQPNDIKTGSAGAGKRQPRT